MPVHRVFLTACAFLVLLASPLPAQGRYPYTELAQRYLNDPPPMIEVAAYLTPEVITRGTRACLDLDADLARLRCSPRELMTLAMLHADAAELLLRRNLPLAARDQTNAGILLLRALRPDGLVAYQPTPSMTLFMHRWYGHLAQVYLINGHMDGARDLVASGMERFGETGELLVSRGMINEFETLWKYTDTWGTERDGALLEKPDRSRFRDLEKAAADYERAVRLDAGNTVAALRLGWVQMLREEPAAWDALTVALAAAPDRDTVYLAHLFRGQVAERHRTHEEALAEYDAARQAAPLSQTACVAVGHIYSVMGDIGRARSIAEECLALASGDEHDAWWVFRLSLMLTEQWLRHQIRE